MFDGGRVKRRREELGLTQRDLGELIGAPQMSIFRYEAGLVKKPPADVLVKLAKALRCSSDFLLGLSPIPESRIEELSPSERELIAAFRGTGGKGRNPVEIAAAMALKRTRQKRKPD